MSGTPKPNPLPGTGVGGAKRFALAFALFSSAVAAGPADAQLAAAPTPTWSDVPALVAAVTGPVADDLRGCVRGPLPRAISIVVTRARDGRAEASLPLPGLGGRGPTPEERCLVRAVARLRFPPLPAGFDQIVLGYAVRAPGEVAASDPAFEPWRDPAAVVAGLVDDEQRTALAACAPRPRTLRIVLDLRSKATRVWLPAWQFHSPTGDGTTPPAERRIKDCLTRAVRALRPPVLPRAMAELHLAIRVTPPGLSHISGHRWTTSTWCEPRNKAPGSSERGRCADALAMPD